MFKDVKSDTNTPIQSLGSNSYLWGQLLQPSALLKQTTPVDYLHHFPSSMNLHGYINRYLYLEKYHKEERNIKHKVFQTTLD